jgi:hypothetical protein
MFLSVFFLYLQVSCLCHRKCPHVSAPPLTVDYCCAKLAAWWERILIFPASSHLWQACARKPQWWCYPGKITSFPKTNCLPCSQSQFSWKLSRDKWFLPHVSAESMLWEGFLTYTKSGWLLPGVSPLLNYEHPADKKFIFLV